MQTKVHCTEAKQEQSNVGRSASMRETGQDRRVFWEKKGAAWRERLWQACYGLSVLVGSSLQGVR